MGAGLLAHSSGNGRVRKIKNNKTKHFDLRQAYSVVYKKAS